MNVSLTMMFGRSGALIGNLLFPVLMNYGCIGPFLMIGVPILGKRMSYASFNSNDNHIVLNSK